MDDIKNPERKTVKIVWMCVLAVLFLMPDCFVRIRADIIHRRFVEYNRETLECYLEEMKEKKTSDVTDSTDISTVVSETSNTSERAVVTTVSAVSSATSYETTEVQETTMITTAPPAEEPAEPSQPDEPVINNEPHAEVPVVQEEPVQPYVEPAPDPQPQPEAQNSSFSYEQSEILRIINEIRSSYGLPGFIMTDQVNAAASLRANETTHSFSHMRPDGRDCFSVAGDLGISAMAMGENIACGNSSPEKTVEQWMNSEGHRNNILNPAFTAMGVGFAKSSDAYGYYWAQFFIG